MSIPNTDDSTPDSTLEFWVNLHQELHGESPNAAAIALYSRLAEGMAKDSG